MSEDNQNQTEAQVEQYSPEQQQVDTGEVISKRIKEVVEEILPAAIGSALSEYERRQQSARDKMMHKINQRFEQHASLLRALGQEITPDVERRILEQAERDVRSEQSVQSAEEVSGHKTEPASDKSVQDMMGAAIQKIFDSFGVVVEDSDPEAAIIASSRDSTELIANVAKAAKIKSERVSSQPKTGGLPVASGRSPAANPVSSAKTADEVWEYVKQQLRGGK